MLIPALEIGIVYWYIQVLSHTLGMSLGYTYHCNTIGGQRTTLGSSLLPPCFEAGSLVSVIVLCTLSSERFSSLHLQSFCRNPGITCPLYHASYMGWPSLQRKHFTPLDISTASVLNSHSYPNACLDRALKYKLWELKLFCLYCY